VDHVPESPVVVEALTAGYAGLGVAGEVVERMAVIADLLVTIGSGRRCQLVGGKSGTNMGGPGRDERRPLGDASGTGARRLAVCVGLEQVEAAALAVHQDLPECRVAGCDCGSGGSGRVRGRGAALAP